MRECEHVHLSWVKFEVVRWEDVSSRTEHPLWGHTGGWDAEKFSCYFAKERQLFTMSFPPCLWVSIRGYGRVRQIQFNLHYHSFSWGGIFCFDPFLFCWCNFFSDRDLPFFFVAAEGAVVVEVLLPRSWSAVVAVLEVAVMLFLPGSHPQWTWWCHPCLRKVALETGINEASDVSHLFDFLTGVMVLQIIHHYIFPPVFLGHHLPLSLSAGHYSLQRWEGGLYFRAQ